MYRVRSTGVWHSLPGVVAAYQPIAAPGPLLAQQNMAHGGQSGHTATQPGAALLWSPFTGWQGNSSGYLVTDIVPPSDRTSSLLVAVSGSPATCVGMRQFLSGAWKGFSVTPVSTTNRIVTNGALKLVSGAITAGVLGFAGTAMYSNGVLDSGAIADVAGTWTLPIHLLGYNNGGSAAPLASGYVRAVLYAPRILSPVEMYYASRQMAYCDVNPDWNAWARRRRYYYAPSAAAIFQPAWARNANTVINQVHP